MVLLTFKQLSYLSFVKKNVSENFKIDNPRFSLTLEWNKSEIMYPFCYFLHYRDSIISI